MFLAVIIPPSRRDKIVGIFVAISFGASYAATVLPWIRDLSAGNRTIILTMAISAIAAILFPARHDVEEAPDTSNATDVTGKEATHE
jgi:hypothetical protein